MLDPLVTPSLILPPKMPPRMSCTCRCLLLSLIVLATNTICVAFSSPTEASRKVPTASSVCLHEATNGDDAPEQSDKSDEAFKQLRISFVTGNEMKRREVNTILTDYGATRGPTPDTSLVDLRLLTVDLPELQEIDTEAIAKNKAIQAAQLANGPCVVEDTSLCFTALGGELNSVYRYE